MIKAMSRSKLLMMIMMMICREDVDDIDYNGNYCDGNDYDGNTYDGNGNHNDMVLRMLMTILMMI